MKLDLSKIRITHCDDDCVTLKHYAGHEIKVYDKKLSKENREALKQMRDKYEKSKQEREAKAIDKATKMAEGGRVAIPNSKDAEAGRQNERQKIELKGAQGRSLDDVKNTLMNPSSWWGDKQPTNGQKRYAEGGDIQAQEWRPPLAAPQDPIDPNTPIELPPMQPQMDIAGAGNAIAPTDPMNPPPAPMGMEAPTPQQEMASMAPQPMAGMPQQPPNLDPTGSLAYNKQMQSGLNQMKQAYETQFQAAKQMGEQKAAADQAYIAQTQKIQDEFNAWNKEHESQVQATVEDIKNNRINPRAYQESMTTGNKIAAAIGLMAGGFGQAYVGGDNPAMEFLNKQIDRDIKAQEANQQNKVTLLNAYQQQFRNKAAAMDMTKATLNHLYASQLSLAANQAATPQAKAQMMFGVGQLQMKAAELTKSATLNEYLAKAQAGGGSPEQMLAIMDQVNPEKAKELRPRLVPGIGFATTQEGAKGILEMQAMAKSVKQDINSLREILKSPLKSLNLNKRAEADTIRKSLVGALRVPITGPGSMSEGDRKLLLDLVADPTSFFSIDSNTKTRLDTLESKMDRQYQNQLEANGLKLPQGFARNPHEGKTAVNDKGQRIIMKNGQWVPVGR